MKRPFTPPDQAQRDRALDPEGSFIVQAPAGSGKTELLVQRYLRLLACVDEPEEVLAVTFTRKAAGEMRNRVIVAIQLAESGAALADDSLRQSRDLARDILRDERRRAWQLHRHPARLAISTIDSVNAWLAGRAPLSAGRSALHAVTDAPESLYREAARATLRLLVEDDATGRNVAALLRHLDNDASRFERLIVAMLPRRDQWLRHVVSVEREREGMERSLRALTEHGLRRTAALLEPSLRLELTELLAYAGRQLCDADSSSALCLWAGRAELPAAVAAELPVWQAMADALLTEEGGWRKSVNARHGFPPKTSEKKRMEQLLQACAGREELREHLIETRILPGGTYAEGQWAVLDALLNVLRYAAAELRLVFAIRGETDFAEVAVDALNALGGGDAPSELGLALDYRIRHVLVDEFQDTSLAQIELLRQLMAGWEPGDGRTIFLVGDPMQSIYRFRLAEVGLFMRVQEEGIGNLRPELLRLTANFRSTPEIVAWVNQTFSHTFPPRDDAVLGAVHFAESAPTRPAGKAGDVASGVTMHWLPAGDELMEAERVVAIVNHCRDEPNAGDVCILVRSRGHAGRIIAALRKAGITFVAPELENMGRASVAQDLLALTRALGHPADRLAWIAVLRARWCGLSLADLHVLAGLQPDRQVTEAVRDSALLGMLSKAGAAAIGRLVSVLDRAEAARGRTSLRDLVEGVWLDLGGPATTGEDGELETAAAFLKLLEGVDAGGDCPDPLWLGEQMSKRHGSLGSGDPGVQVMTMHKAKGLEFDTVILPGLDKRTRGNEPSLLLWYEPAADRSGSPPVLAPVAASGTGEDPLYRYLADMERRKQSFETDRLIYVACTRARRCLHLLARIGMKPNIKNGEITIRKPWSGSVLERLWPAIAGQASDQMGHLPLPIAQHDEIPHWVQPQIRRLPASWRPPPVGGALRLRGAAPVAAGAEPLQYEWASTWARHAGSVVHHWLRVIADQGVEQFDCARIRGLESEFRRMLEQLGAERGELTRAVPRVSDALCATLGDARGRWILSSEHAQARSELPLTICDGDLFREIVIDRTFIAADGCRWIIDYKVSTHEGGDRDEFLRAESDRHRAQLRCYRNALAAFGNEPIRTALYFPLLTAFHEIAMDANTPAG